MGRYFRKTEEDLVKKFVPSRPSARSSGRLTTPLGASLLTYCKDDNSKRLSTLYDPTSADTYFDQCFKNPVKLGEGSYGIVYRVVGKEDGVTYAVKKFKKKVYSDKQWRKCAREVRNHELIPSHDNIVKLYIAWEEADLMYMQMEWCSETLENYGVRCFPILEECLWKILLDVALGLKHLHDHELLHIDMKLENIMRGAAGSWKIGDFGHLVDLSQGPVKDVSEGDSKYLAPELLDFNCPVTKAADIFSLGVCFLELACNIKLPAGGDTWHELRSGEFPIEEAEHLGADFYGLIKLMMHPNYKLRPDINGILKVTHLKKLQDLVTPHPSVAVADGLDAPFIQ